MAPQLKLRRDRVTINEETLRDGEQTAGVTFLREDKLAIAALLAEALPGAIINAGYPPISPAEFAAVQAVARATTGAHIQCGGRATRDDLRLCYEAVRDAAAPRVAFWFPTTRMMLDARLGRSPQAMLDEALELVAWGRELCGDRAAIDVAFNDASRADRSFIVEACARLTEAGAGLLMISDSVGRMLPHEVYELIHAVATAAPQAELCFHGHNDLGNGTANAIAALRAGALSVATTVNGLGDQTMPPTEEVVANLLLRPDVVGLPLEADSTLLPALSRLVAERSGLPPQFTKPVVGAGVLRRETGTHIDWLLRAPESFQLVTPAFLGAERLEFVVGKMSSKGSVAAALAQRDIHLSEAQNQLVFHGVKELTATQRQVSEADLLRLVNQARRAAP
jgi:2-isopropylmalate synthase